MPLERDPNQPDNTEPEARPVPDAAWPEVAEYAPDGPAPVAPLADASSDEEISFDVPAPNGDPGSFTMGMAFADLPDIADLAGLPRSNDPPSGIPPIAVSAMIPMAEAPLVDEDELVPLAASVPSADPGSSTTLATHLDPPSGLNLTADSGTRLADLARRIPPFEADNKGDSGVLENLEPIAPVQPASGWFEHHEEAPLSSEGNSLPTALPVSELGFAPSAGVESSDIFAAGPVPLAADAADVSDVIAATAGPPLAPFGASASKRPVEGPGRSSDVALSFDAPPGGSTVADPTANAGLPVADDEDEPVFAAEAVDDSPLDSAQLARTPDLPDRHDEADLGTSPPLLADASSILAELSGQPDGYSEDSSAIRLEAPGVDRTLTDEPYDASDADAEYDLTEADIPLPGTLPPTDAQKPGVIRGDSVDDVDIGRAESGRSFEDEANAAHPAGQSSIFADLQPVGKLPSGGSGDVPITEPDFTDSVDFSDHPDMRGADSGSFHRGVAPPAAAADDDGMIDWNAAEGHPEATMGIGAAGIPSSLFTGPASGILSRGRKDDPLSTDAFDAALADDASAESTPTKAAKPVKPGQGKAASAIPPQSDSDPSVVVEWMADSKADEPPVVAAKSRPTRSQEKDRAKPRSEGTDPTRPVAASAAKGGMSRVLGPVLGLVVGVGACAGAYYSGVIGDGKPTASNTAKIDPPGPSNSTGGTPSTSAPSGLALVRSNPADAVRELEAAGATTPEAKANLGEARLLAALRQSAAGGTPIGDDDLKQARADLAAAAGEAEKTPEGEASAVRATLKLALSYEVAGDLPAARKIYSDGMTRFPSGKAAFEAALDRLDATATSRTTSSRLTPADAEQLVVASNVLTTLNPPPATSAAAELPEAGPAFWKAVNAAAKGDYDAAVRQIDEAKKLHIARAKALAGQGLNPSSDPLEQMFPRCCDDLKASWEFKKSQYPKLIAAEKELAGQKLALATAQQQLKTEKERADKAAADLKIEKDGAAKLAEDLKAEKAVAVKLKDDLKKSDEAVTDLTAKVKKATDDNAGLVAKVKDAADALAVAEKARTDAQATLDTIAKELQAAKILPAKYDAASLVASVRGAAKVASNPDLAGAVERAVKAEADAKAAKDALAKAAVKAEADAKAAKDAHAVEVKKLKEATADEVKKAEDFAAADKKKLADDYAAEAKKLKDAQAVELKKQADANTTALTALQAQVADEKAKAAALTKKFETDLGNAVSPSAALDQWLTILTGLRRPADADPAIAAAAKLLASAPPGSEDHAKAQTVTGLALLIKGDSVGAKILFIQAKATAAYKEAMLVRKPWAQAADVGLASVDDPVAPLRKPVEGPTKDPVLAAKNFDAGVTAYRAGRFAEAEKALAQAAWHDESNPLTWYFLGAARWHLGRIDQAREDFKQGAEREKKRTVSTRSIERAIGPIQGAARDALAEARR